MNSVKIKSNSEEPIDSLAVDATEKVKLKQTLTIGPEKAYGVRIFAESSERIYNDRLSASVDGEPIECNRVTGIFVCEPVQNPMENGEYDLGYNFAVRPDGSKNEFEIKFWINDTNIESSQSEKTFRIGFIHWYNALYYVTPYI